MRSKNNCTILRASCCDASFMTEIEFTWRIYYRQSKDVFLLGTEQASIIYVYHESNDRGKVENLKNATHTHKHNEFCRRFVLGRRSMQLQYQTPENLTPCESANLSSSHVLLIYTASITTNWIEYTCGEVTPRKSTSKYNSFTHVILLFRVFPLNCQTCAPISSVLIFFYIAHVILRKFQRKTCTEHLTIFVGIVHTASCIPIARTYMCGRVWCVCVCIGLNWEINYTKCASFCR